MKGEKQEGVPHSENTDDNQDRAEKSGEKTRQMAVDPRQAQLDELAVKARKRREAEREQQGDTEDELTGDEQRAETSAEPKGPASDEEKSPPEEGGSIFYEKDGVRYAKSKVNGEEQEFTEEQILANHQRHLAARREMEEAAAVRKQLQQDEQRLLAWAQRLNQQEEAKSQQEETSADDEGAYKELLDAIYDGDEDKALQAFKKLPGRNSATPSIDEESIVSRTRDEVLGAVQQREKERELNEAVQRFHSDYSDLAEDPVLFAAVDQKTVELESLHPDWGPAQLLTEAGNQIREWRDKKVGVAPASRRVERKRNAAKPVGGVSQAAKLGEDDAPPPTRSDVIQRMRDARGQRF